MKIGLMGLWAQKLLRPNGENLTAFRLNEPKGGMAILAANLLDSGCEVRLLDLKKGSEEMEYGAIEWCGETLTKIAVGLPLTKVNTDDCDIIGVTVNYHQEQEIALMVIREMKRRGHKVIVGGSEAFVDSSTFLAAGTDVVVRDKSGGSNQVAIQVALDLEPISSYRLVTKQGDLVTGHPRLHPENWPLPPMEVISQTLGTTYWEGRIPTDLLPIGAVMLDHGCDRQCDFCETPLYGLGYQDMSPAQSLRWLEAQKATGARSVIILSDQFLGRNLWPDGRSQILEIMAGLRELGLAVLWGNGLELAKATKGRGYRNSDPTPDEELVQALWGWDPVRLVGCAQAYIPGERPANGPRAYAKLLEWSVHLEMMQAITAAGVPDLTYGVIVGMPEDSDESLGRLYNLLSVLRTEVKKVNPGVRFRVCPFGLRPIIGTESTQRLVENGLVEYIDPVIAGGFWTPCARTESLSVREIFSWQKKIMSDLSDPEPGWQGITALT